MTLSNSVPPKRSKDLENAVYDDWKRKAIDSAKKRAVAQMVDYDTFKNMVLVAHLKPLTSKSEVEDNLQSPGWSVGRDGKPAPKAACTSSPIAINFPPQRPTASADFSRSWRRCANADSRYAYLQQFDAPSIQKLFCVEIPSVLLGEIILTVAECWLAHSCIGIGASKHAGQNHSAEALASVNSPEDREASSVEAAPLQRIEELCDLPCNRYGSEVVDSAVWVVNVFQALAHAKRFELTAKLLPNRIKKVLDSLFSELSDAIECTGGQSDTSSAHLQEIQSLRSDFGVQVTK